MIELFNIIEMLKACKIPQLPKYRNETETVMNFKSKNVRI